MMSRIVMQRHGVTRRDAPPADRPVTAFSRLEGGGRREEGATVPEGATVKQGGGRHCKAGRPPSSETGTFPDLKEIRGREIGV